MEPRPYTLVAELTYKCPLRCGYCSNPTELDAHDGELPGGDWTRVLTEAEEIGVMGVNLTGGEPLLRKDLEALVAHARRLGLYTNLITSGVPLTRARLVALRDAGLDHVQLSFQGPDAATSDAMAGTSVFDAKLEVAGWVKEVGLPLTINAVLHEANVDRTEDLIALAERLRADRLELAHTQYLGWALVNRDTLLPTATQIERSRAAAKGARERLRGRMELAMVLPDYVAGRPRACMDGWGRRFIVVSPSGLVLPCHAAHTLPGVTFDSVRERPLGDIWRSSAAFERFRGEAWMPEPCRSCDQRAVDYGGCRCQAFHLTGDASSTDPACALAPAHGAVASAVRNADSTSARPPLVLRARVARRLPVAR
jgi:pyrroloquinoline quinone biosynthesis protein E